ncbi:acyl-CoA synthetase, putative [Plasmodium vivax]|uniref:Acyl-CoA synthetase, putative n=1 Tax=Plasmodium vivax TaxID=5855 RepID=A0A1G4HKY0_PLAVI|nr:acyl-CoA synthetase, putative [Plasmodium vivax]SCO75637.1 acyl-CoA synthetase, putative [Plasmodium vivax]VUZ99094.1 acyl-CoA synthetase, putative [Plasmodium vivax]
MDVTSFKRKVYTFLENESEYLLKKDDGEESDDASEIKYFEEVKGTAKKNSSNIFRPTKYELCQSFEKTKGFLGIEMSNKYEVFCFACNYYYDEDFLGERKKEVRGNETILGEYSFKTYGEIKNEIEILASALYQFETIEPNTFTDNGAYDKLKILGIWSKNRVEWLTTDYACSAIDFVTVPIYDTMGINSVKYIFQKTQMKICCIEAEKLECLIKLKDELADLQILIIYDEWSLRDDIKQRASKAGYKVYFYKGLIDKFKNQNIIPQCEFYDHAFHSQEKAGKSVPKRVSGGKGQPGGNSTSGNNALMQKLKKNKGKVTDVCTIIFTSGSSGMPKGAMLTHNTFITFLQSYIIDGNRLGLIKHDVVLSYLPLAHVYERLIEFALCFFGAKIGYFSGNIKELVSDINELKPSFLITVPRILQKIHDNVMEGLKNKSFIARTLVRTALKNKKSIYLKNPKKFSHPIYDIILQPVRNRFGGRIRTQVMGSASMDKNKLIDLQMLFSAPISEGWGMTEVGVGFLQHRYDSTKGTIGGMFSNVSMKVVKVENMKYDPKAYPNRGELCVKGSSLMVGYFRDEQLTKKSFDEDGFFYTGDVVEVNENNAYVRIIDRAKNIFKLAQGEYIEPEKLENLYTNSIYIENIFVHGYNYENELVSIIVPNEIFVRDYAKKNNLNMPFEELLKCDAIKKLFHNEILAMSKTYNLNGIEKIHLFHLTPIPFSVENKQLTPTHKVVRNAILADYKQVIDDLYQSRKK